MGWSRVAMVMGVWLVSSTRADGQLPADRVPDGAVVVATASAGAMVRPDRAAVLLELASASGTPSETARDVALLRRAVTEALAEAGLGAEISPTGYAVGAPWSPQGRPRPPGATDPARGRVGLRVEVEVARVDEVVETALAAGASAVQAVLYWVEDDGAARERVVQEAVRAARRDAGAMAEAEGGSLGSLVQLSILPSPAGVSTRARLRSGGWMDAGVVLPPQDVQVEVSVRGTWTFVPR